jgi:hypothetical protein
MSKAGLAEGCRRVPRRDPAQYLGDNGDDELPFAGGTREEELDAILAEYGFVDEEIPMWDYRDPWESAKPASPVRRIVP